jgi:hypothetical protein
MLNSNRGVVPTATILVAVGNHHEASDTPSMP